MGSGVALIIEDQALNAELLRRLLTLHGLESVTVETPAQLNRALAALSAVVVIFLDLELPEQDGYDVLKQLKADARWSGVPVIAYTADTAEMKKAHAAGFDGFLGKPLQAQQFGKYLWQILQGERIWEA